MNNKKAQIPEAVLILIAIALCGAALYYSVNYTSTRAESIDISKAVNMFHEQEKFAVYAQEAMHLALQQAYANTAEKPTTCPTVGTISLWKDTCHPSNQEIKNKLKTEFDKQFSFFVNKSFNSEIKDRLDVNITTNFSASNANKFVSYNISYSAPLLLSSDYPGINFEHIYSAVSAKKTECDKRFETNTEADKSTKIMRCLNEVRFDNWNAAIDESGNYYLFSLSSKKSHFYSSSFKPIELKFAINK